MPDLPMGFTRRTVLASALAAGIPLGGLTLLRTTRAQDNRFVMVILRGGMDGLYIVPPLGDPDFVAARGLLADYKTPPLPLSDIFALHPNLPQMQAMYRSKELAVLHATGMPYYGRSHFDAQNVLETAGKEPFQLSTGWLGRAIGATRGIAVTTAPPLIVQGAANFDTWTPSNSIPPSRELLQRLASLYRSDPGLGTALRNAEALHPGEATRDLKAIRPETVAYDSADPRRAGRVLASGSDVELETLARQAAEFLGMPDGPRIAVLEQGGWDSHVKENHPSGPINSQMAQLDNGLAALRQGLMAKGVWKNTLVVVATEFGRTVAINGTNGTDHGTGGAAFVLGGGIRGGRVLGDWPGLAVRNRFEERDLKITTDLRSLFRTALIDHLHIATRHVDQEVLPGTAHLPRVEVLA